MRLLGPQNKVLASIVVALICIVTFTYSVFGETRPKKPQADFGAGTVDGAITGYIKPVTPLPLDLVEERDVEPSTQVAAATGPAQQPAASAEAAANKPHDGPGDAAQAISSPEADQEITTVLNANEVDISTLAKTFSKLAKRNYILDSNVKGKVTLHLPSGVTLDEALRLFDTILLFKGFTAVPVSGNTWKIVKAKDAKQTTIPTLDKSESQPSDTLVTQLVRLRYAQADDMQQLASQLISSDGSVTAFAATNSLIIIDSALNIERIVSLLSKLDLPATDQEITIIPVLHADAQDIADKVNEILGNKEGTPKSGTPQVSGTRRAASTAPATPATPYRPPVAGSTPAAGSDAGKAKSLPLKVIPDDRTNSIIVVADQDLTAKVQALIEQLDSEIDRSSGRFYVYNLQHADAEEVANIISSLISGNSSPTSSSNSEQTKGSSITRSSRESASQQRSSMRSAAPGLTRAAATETQAATPRSSQRRSIATASSGGGNEGKVNFEGEVFVAADPATNSLIINATRSDYLKLTEVIKALDIRRRQVLVEATILEVTLSKIEGMGIELQGTGANMSAGGIVQSNFGSLSNLLTNPAALSDFVLAAASSGTVTLPGGITIPSQAVLVSALSKLSNVNVLSTPTILATDNEEAEIIVGENVPFVTSKSTDTSNISNTFNQIERQDVGITLRITPQISSGSFVALKIFVEISNVVTGTQNDANGPTTTIRTTDTSVEVKDGQMVVTGGLISDDVTQSSRGVPFLQDIPVLGNLFRRDDTDQRRTNLMLFLTPKIVNNQYEAREQTRRLAAKLEGTLQEHPDQPQREELFKNEAMDNVVESAPPSSRIPTRITPAGTTMRGTKISEDEIGTEATKPEKPKTAARRAPKQDKNISDLAPEKSDSMRSTAGAEHSVPPGNDPIEITVAPELPAVATPPSSPAVSSSASPSP